MRKKSRYKPKGVRLDVMNWVQSGLKPFNAIEYGVGIRIKNHDALKSLSRGEAKQLDITTLVDAMNMTEGFVRLRQDLGADWLDEIRAAQDALFDVVQRGVKTQRYVCKAAELTAINLALEIHDSQLDGATVRDVEDCLGIVSAVMKNRRARKIGELNET